ncbi:YtpI family protein [Bacillus stratosphericus]|uniref:YtpI family protein n=1 Tax=Bacillus stratosphericus TaxID=293386 RepID=UPI001CFA6B5E|nr:YtpI family protein [Bacillus stratosphericus]
MLVLVVFIICSAMFYLYYKAKNVRTNRPVEKKFWSAKSSMALGCFVLLFGVNQLFLNRSSLAFVIGFIFVAVGIGSTWAGYKAYKHYLPLFLKKGEKDHA